MSIDTPNNLEITDEDIPRLASKAGRAAYEKALAAGKSVVIAEGSMIYRVFPDGKRVGLKSIPPRTSAKLGQIFRIS